MNPLYQKHIISINDLSREELELVLATAAKLKANPQPELLKQLLHAPEQVKSLASRGQLGMASAQGG